MSLYGGQLKGWAMVRALARWAGAIIYHPGINVTFLWERRLEGEIESDFGFFFLAGNKKMMERISDDWKWHTSPPLSLLLWPSHYHTPFLSAGSRSTIRWHLSDPQEDVRREGGEEVNRGRGGGGWRGGCGSPSEDKSEGEGKRGEWDNSWTGKWSGGWRKEVGAVPHVPPFSWLQRFSRWEGIILLRSCVRHCYAAVLFPEALYPHGSRF